MSFLNDSKEILNELIEIRREFHKNPELDYDLDKTSKIIKKYLKEENIEYIDCAKSGIIGIIKGKIQDTNSKTIGIRADMDALPIIEGNDLDYKSMNEGKMHACGHDGHMTILLGTAKLLNKYKENIRGNIKLIFEPAEETSGGARLMIKEGALKNPTVDAIIGCHVDEGLRTGIIGVKKGIAYASSNPFTVTIRGKGAHGASPYKGIDPIVIAAQVINSVQTLITREISPTSPALITFGSINGGTAGNIIPDKVVLKGIIRTIDLKDREFLVRRFRNLIESIVDGMRGTCEIIIDESYPCVINDSYMVNILKESANRALDKNNIVDIQQPTMGVESFSYFSLEKPAVFYQLGCRNDEKGIIHPLHSPLFNLDEEALMIGVAVNCELAIEYLNNF